SLPAAPLVEAFAGAAEGGLDARFFDAAGKPLDPNPARLQTADTTGARPAAATSVRLEGYFEVVRPGPHRLFVRLDKKAARATLRVGTLVDPVVDASAAEDGAELSDTVELRAGTPYYFSLDAGALGGGDVRLSIQGETLAKNPLSEVTLYAKTTVERIDRARILLEKTFQIVARLALGERELRYLLAHVEDFDGLSFSRLPTHADEQYESLAPSRFRWLLRLLDYTRLRRDVADGGPDLIDLFENARRTVSAAGDVAKAGADMVSDLCARLAGLVRREPAAVQALA